MGRVDRRRLLGIPEYHGCPVGETLGPGGSKTHHPGWPGEYNVLFYVMGDVDQSTDGYYCQSYNGWWEW